MVLLAAVHALFAIEPEAPWLTGDFKASPGSEILIATQRTG